MGHNPIPMRPPWDSQEWALSRVRGAYLRGEIVVERLEELIAYVLTGGQITEALGPGDSPFRDPARSVAWR